MSLDYKTAGVDVEAGEALVDWLKSQPPIKTPFSKNLLSGIGGFSALFQANFKDMEEPCLVSSTDGVGTKLRLAIDFNKHDNIGQDLVAMCVNDLLCCGALPLFFLDYFATAQLKLPQAKIFLAGLRQACSEAQILLVGGETAEMPGMYHNNDYDLAGFAVGVVDKKNILGAHRVNNKNRVFGIASSGFHSNGYSLLRKVFSADLNHWIDELLKPTALYTSLALKIYPLVNALAHITGGGMKNVLRVLPPELGWDMKKWNWPPSFLEVQKRAGLSHHQMLDTLNCGIGLVAIVNPENVQHFLSKCENYQVYDLGVITDSSPQQIVGDY